MILLLWKEPPPANVILSEAKNLRPLTFERHGAHSLLGRARNSILSSSRRWLRKACRASLPDGPSTRTRYLPVPHPNPLPSIWMGRGLEEESLARIPCS